MSQNPIIPIPHASHLQEAFHAIKRVHGTDVALILPDQASSLAEIPGLEQVLAWAAVADKDVTLVGGSPTARAEAVVRGLRAATDITAWQGWLAEAHVHAAHQDRRMHSTSKHSGWRLIQRTPPPSDDTPPAFVTALGEQSGILAFGTSSDSIPCDERYEAAVIALVWQTSKLDALMPTANNG